MFSVYHPILIQTFKNILKKPKKDILLIISCFNYWKVYKCGKKLFLNKLINDKSKITAMFYSTIQVHLNKLECRGKVILFQ